MASDQQWKQWLAEYEVVHDKDVPVKEEPEKVPETPKQTVFRELQCLADMQDDSGSGITWDLYRANQRDKLELKVRIALFPDTIQVDEKTGKVSSNCIFLEIIIYSLYPLSIPVGVPRNE